jgi:putative CocE/NonD family hydrolase
MMKAVCCGMLLCLFAMPVAFAQQVDLPWAAPASDSGLAAAMSALAQEVIVAYSEIDRDKYLDNLFRLQIVVGHCADASQSLVSLRQLRRSGTPTQAVVTTVRWEIYAEAKSRQVSEKLSFDEAFKQTFREVFGALDDKTASQVLWSFGTPLTVLQNDLHEALNRQIGKTAIALPDAVDLIRKYLGAQAYGNFQPLIAELADEDDRRRYTIEKDILVRTRDGATVCTLVARPRVPTGRFPALLNFTIYADPNKIMSEARRTASNGYAGVEGLTRGKGCSPDKPVPIEHDGSDAAAVIDWISTQPWSDGRVGMYGGSYEGFTQWAAAKHMPKALKAMMPSVTFAPGIDFPAPQGVYQSYGYPWPFYTTNVKGLDDATYFDSARWNRMNHDWYVSGRAYRDLDKIDGTPNPIWDRWVDHPTYDKYWQSAIPYKDEFARINIPVLTTTGYYDDGQIGALYYFTQHYKYLPTAEHYLLIGPYNHISGQRGTGGSKTLMGYVLDPAAQIDIGELRYQWFDYVFKGAPKPALLQDKVNYEVMGANIWKHAPSVGAMSNAPLRFYLTAAGSGDAHDGLSKQKPAGHAVVSQTIDFRDRTDVDRFSAADDNETWNGIQGIVGSSIDTMNAVEFVSAPFAEQTEVSGLFSGRLVFATNKKDFDFDIQLYELKPDGEHLQLAWYWSRASLVADRSHRRLLTPGKPQSLDFESSLLMSRQFQPGSRLVVVLSVLKRPNLEINYGTGKNVSDETVADSRQPLQIQWFDDSFINIPAWR